MVLGVFFFMRIVHFSNVGNIFLKFMLIQTTSALLIQKRVFSKFYEATPFCTILRNISKAQTQLERSLFADSQEMFFSSLHGREKKSLVESSNESNSVFSFWITLLNNILIRGGIVNLPVCVTIFLKYA